ncbi:MAG: hypothetical protein HY922_07470 [Elusimicrobia bacterium]|nr:hypothetical protein [Elusimicrobiota bacterium]
MSAPSQDFEKNIKDAVVSQLKGAPDLPAKTASLLKTNVADALRSPSSQGSGQADMVRWAAAGAMKGLILLRADLGLCSVAVIRGIGDAALEAQIDPQDSMTWAMQGIASASKLMQEAAIAAIQNEIEANFMGAGVMFSEFCLKARSAG